MVVYDGNWLWAWNGLPLNKCLAMYARTNRCYNERGSRTSYVRSSIPHCIYVEFAWWKGKEQSEDSAGRDSNRTYTAAATLKRPTNCGYGVTVRSTCA